MTTYRHTLHNPKFLNQKGETMPNNSGWQGRHLLGLKSATMTRVPAHPMECAIVSMLDAWALYADAHRARYESGIGEDGVIGAEWRAMGLAIRGLLNGDCGRLDCGTIDGFICNTLAEEGIPADA